MADFAALRAAYGRAGLLGEAVPGSPAWKLLGGGEDIGRFRREFLLLDALLRHRVALLMLDGGRLRHVAVFGGNNVGKSTAVNILARSAVADVSPEGGHTRHPQVFASDPAPLFGRNPYPFQGFEAVAASPGPDPCRDCYILSRLGDDAMLPGIALWDTPDCDAVGSARYVGAVVETVAAADVLLYVTSVEKYAVEQLVEWVFQLHDAGIPIVECLNKTARKDRAAVIRRQNDVIFPTMARQLGLPAPEPPVVALRTMTEGEESDLWGPEHPEAGQLREEVLSVLRKTSRAAAGRQALAYVLRRLDHGLAPAQMEIEARRRWAAAVEAAVEGFVASYERGYLTSATVIEPISRLNVQILELLDPDIPGLKQTMATIRWVTRWPAKLILAIGRGVFSLLLGGANGDAPVPPELKVYSEAHVQLLNTLGRRIDAEREARRHHPFWDALAEEWQDRLQDLSKNFALRIEAHIRRTEEEITAAARDIFNTLRERPATLNALRGIRVAASVGGALAGFFLPVKGSFVFDLLEEAVIAPTLLSAAEAATSTLAQNYVTGRRDAVVAKLKKDAVVIAETLYKEPLLAIAEGAMARVGALGIDEDILRRLPENLRRLQAEFARGQG
ncbi:MAG TPA: GTPase domain-containing protein [Stellaceae bacterium]|nr:GTPase domain-containing protein [Stellaceae bacterium]